MLYEEFYTPCQIVQPDRVKDGQGGWTTKWIDGEEFMAAVVLDTSVQATIAESQGMNRSYRVTTPTGTNLAFHTVFKRLSDGQAFRVTSEASDIKTPSVASFQFEIVKAEAWVIPDE